ncbi:MAG TPA: type III pantothenate kinase [Flavobacteriales bacterium]|nr:type III pantothenate kinase [Flavobacteriales bacterium]
MEKLNLIVDLGNSYVKFCFATQDVLGEKHSIPNHEALITLEKELEKVRLDSIILSSTASEEQTKLVLGFLESKGNVHYLSPKSELIFEMAYQTPGTLGLDRIANMSAAAVLFPGISSLVIDIGTCITYDVLSGGAVYCGGAITPGWRMRLKSMNDYSARLPSFEMLDFKTFPGKSTEDSLKSGVFYGILGEIHQFINETEQSFGEVKVLITGGDAFHFVGGIKKTIFANPKLTLKGLYEILKHNN